MPDRVLFIGWSQTVRGREQRALEVFNEAISLYGSMQQDGRVERFEVCLLEPHGGGLEGFITLYGSEDQIAAVRSDDDFQRSLVEANLVVDDLGAVAGWVDDGVAHQMAMFQDALGRVGPDA